MPKVFFGLIQTKVLSLIFQLYYQFKNKSIETPDIISYP